MRSHARLFVLALIAGTTACAALRQDRIAIRAVGEARVGSGAMPRTIAAGDALLARGEYALAIDAYRQAVYDDPSSARGYNGMAIAYASIGRYDLSGRFFELALSRAPTDAKIYRNLARSLDQQGRHQEALAVQGNMEDILHLAQAKAAEQPETIMAGNRLLARGEYALAVDAFRQAVYDDPSNARGYEGMAIAYASMGRYDLSGRFFELALSRAPGEAKIYRNLARSLDQQGRHQEALAVQRNMEDALRLAEAKAAAERLATVGPERQSLASLAGESALPSATTQESGPYLERRSLGEVMLVTAPSSQARVPAARTTGEKSPAWPKQAVRADIDDPTFARLWDKWPAPRPTGSNRKSGAL